jgi:hypothetical protein
MALAGGSPAANHLHLQRSSKRQADLEALREQIEAVASLPSCAGVPLPELPKAIRHLEVVVHKESSPLPSKSRGGLGRARATTIELRNALIAVSIRGVMAGSGA